MKKIYIKEQNQDGYVIQDTIKHAKGYLIDCGGGYLQVFGQEKRWHESAEGGRWEYYPEVS